MKTYQTGEHSSSPNLVRLNIHLKRNQAPRLVALADTIARLKGRGVRLGEALEVVLAYANHTTDEELLKQLTSDRQCSDWLSLPVLRRNTEPAVPQALRMLQLS